MAIEKFDLDYEVKVLKKDVFTTFKKPRKSDILLNEKLSYPGSVSLALTDDTYKFCMYTFMTGLGQRLEWGKNMYEHITDIEQKTVEGKLVYIIRIRLHTINTLHAVKEKYNDHHAYGKTVYIQLILTSLKNKVDLNTNPDMDMLLTSHYHPVSVSCRFSSSIQLPMKYTVGWGEKVWRISDDLNIEDNIEGTTTLTVLDDTTISSLNIMIEGGYRSNSIVDTIKPLINGISSSLDEVLNVIQSVIDSEKAGDILSHSNGGSRVLSAIVNTDNSIIMAPPTPEEGMRKEYKLIGIQVSGTKVGKLFN